MLIREIEGATRHLGAPANWDQSKGACDVLPIADVMTESGPFMVSAWTPTADELAALNSGAPVYLWIEGSSHPVVALTVSETSAAQAAPMQPLVVDSKGTIRFKENAIVRHLLDKGGIDLSMLAREDFTDDDRMQFAQLIGYSVSGYGELSYVSGASYEIAAAHAEKITEGNRAPIDVHQQPGNQQPGNQQPGNQ